MVEKMKMGRPKSKLPTRNRSVAFRLSEAELLRARKICIANRINYIDIFLKGLEYWSDEK